MKLFQLPLSKALTIFFVVISLVSVLVIFSSLIIIKDMSVSHLATNEATKLSELIFQNLYNAMKRGWTKDDINEIVNNMEDSIDDIDITLYRSDEVKQLYGNIIDRQHPPMIDFDVQEVFASAQAKLIEKEQNLRFIYPIKVTQQCLGCHSNSSIGNVNGIVNITMPLNKLRLPFEYTITYVVYLFLLFILILGVLTYLVMRNFIIRPVEQLSATMREVEETHNYALPLPEKLKSFAEIAGLFKTYENLMIRVEQAQSELRDHSEKDVLTGLYNRRKFNELANNELKRSQRHAHPISFLVIDLNKFKPVNDEYGHDAGDEILVNVSRALSGYLRDEDILARIGGDEFVIILPETYYQQALQAVKRIEEIVTSASIDRDGKSISVGCSIGISVYPEDGKDIKTLFNVADERMYENKNNKR